MQLSQADFSTSVQPNPWEVLASTPSQTGWELTQPIIPATAGGTTSGFFDTLTNLAKTAIPLYTQIQQQKTASDLQRQQLEYQYKVAQLQAQRDRQFPQLSLPGGLPYLPQQSTMMGGMMPLILIGGGLLAAYILLK